MKSRYSISLNLPLFIDDHLRSHSGKRAWGRDGGEWSEWVESIRGRSNCISFKGIKLKLKQLITLTSVIKLTFLKSRIKTYFSPLSR